MQIKNLRLNMIKLGEILAHLLGLGCLGGSVFLQCLMFFDIANQGYFSAVENDPFILSFEIVLTGFSLSYFLFLWIKFIRTVDVKGVTS